MVSLVHRSVEPCPILSEWLALRVGEGLEAFVRRYQFAPDLRADVWDRTGGRCGYCGIELNPWRNFCIDHIVPLAKGGSNNLLNLMPSCRECNGSKGAKTLGEWRERSGWVVDFWFERNADYFDRERTDHPCWVYCLSGEDCWSKADA